MSTQQDASLGIKKESSYGTIGTADHFYEYLTEDFDWSPTFANGKGMRVGKIVQAADRRVLVKEESGGSVELELFTKGMGALFEAALGTAVSTLITGSSYQQLITPTTGDFLPSYTVQVGVPILGGSPAAQTYAGQVCEGFELDAKNGDIPTVKFTFRGKSMDTSTALTSPSYPASNALYTFVNGAITIGGSLTLPTTTALATGGTAVADVREATISWTNGLDDNGFNLGSQGQRTRKPAIGDAGGSGKLTLEYDSNTMRDAFKSQTDLALVLTFQSTVAISGSNYPTVQIVIPDIRLDGEMPKPNAGDVITQDVPFTVLDNRVSASAFYVVIVTAETAI